MSAVIPVRASGTANVPRVCLIVDNPLRDLDGLVLAAWQLAARGIEAILVPMYDQGFDVPALAADAVVLNYLRPNNVDLVRSYRQRGMRIIIMDTEGAAGRTPDDFARYALAGGDMDLVDAYCTWGNGQHQSLLRSGALAPERLHVTGCPRYDFCASPWHEALEPPSLAPGYILINTNFPTVNPRFSKGAGSERQAMVAAGAEPDFADAYIDSARHAMDGMLSLVSHLCNVFPDVQFVLRPHPFESMTPYGALGAHRNFCLRQEGTSLQWLRHAAALIHLNCSTAVEAFMLGCEPISPAWLNSDYIEMQAPSAVSSHAGDLDTMTSLITRILSGAPKPADASLTASRATLVDNVYHAIDGQAGARLARCIETTLASPARSYHPAPSHRGRLVSIARQMLGPAAMGAAVQWLRPGEARRRQSKLFTAEVVSALLKRLDTAAHGSGLLAPSAHTQLLSTGGPGLSGHALLIRHRDN
jgi:surface carbohydrate biosynthesis protein